jgi:hypothetical protein
LRVLVTTLISLSEFYSPAWSTHFLSLGGKFVTTLTKSISQPFRMSNLGIGSSVSLITRKTALSLMASIKPLFTIHTRLINHNIEYNIDRSYYAN